MGILKQMHRFLNLCIHLCAFCQRISVTGHPSETDFEPAGPKSFSQVGRHKALSLAEMVCAGRSQQLVCWVSGCCPADLDAQFSASVRRCLPASTHPCSSTLQAQQTTMSTTISHATPSSVQRHIVQDAVDWQDDDQQDMCDVDDFAVTQGRLARNKRAGGGVYSAKHVRAQQSRAAQQLLRPQDRTRALTARF